MFADSFSATRPGYILQMHTEALLLTLPTPDFSMPYNVICFNDIDQGIEEIKKRIKSIESEFFGNLLENE